MIVMTFEAAGYRDIQGRYAKRSDDLIRNLRTAVKEQTRGLIVELRAEAPKRSGEFAAGIHYRTTISDEGVKSTIYVRGKHAFLLPIIVGGSKPHEIPRGGSLAQLAKGYPLRFFWEDGPRGPDIYYFWSVWHPGTKEDDFVQRALDSKWDDMATAIRRVARGTQYTYEAGTGG